MSRSRLSPPLERCSWPVRAYRLGEEPSDNLSANTTAEERLAMMWPLAIEAWELSGRTLPEYPRSEIPVRLRPWPPPPDLVLVNEDFRDLLAALLDAQARFLVVGAHAGRFTPGPVHWPC